VNNSMKLVVSCALFGGACNQPQPSPARASKAPTESSARAATSPSVAPISPSAAASGVPMPTSKHTWNFDRDTGGTAPQGFSFARTGDGRPGEWVVRSEAGAPSGGNVLAQLDADSTDYRFPIAVANQPLLRDGRVSVRCKPVSGRVDQACGLVFRYQDADNYYVTRANALESNVRLYHVVGGHRKEFASWSGKVSTGAWHAFRVDAKADHFEVYWDGKKIIDAHDTTFAAAGKAGVWTKADSVTYFDDLEISSS
jgi:hypothetical protein